ncbi:hypothetical protein HanIR_Chr02g0080071 [Helianthus annuus]|nr:hypothetical protein HanIR_Chr02g0080071 [Helianthus annuus]
MIRSFSIYMRSLLTCIDTFFYTLHYLNSFRIRWSCKLGSNNKVRSFFEFT